MTNPFITSLRAAIAKLAAEDASIRDDVAATLAAYVTTSALETALAAYATDADVAAAVAALVDSSPGTLDTLNELAAALGDDPNFATTIATALGQKSAIGHTHLITEVSGLQAALDGKSATGHGHAQSDITGLEAALAALVPLAVVDAKGDLIVGTGPDVVGRLAPTTDGHVLTLDSAQALGVKWAAAAGGGGSGLVTYADAAAVAAVTTTELGMIDIDDFAAFFGTTGGIVQSWSGGIALVESTLSNNYSSSPNLPPAGAGSLQQVVRINDGNGSLATLRRHKLFNGSVWGVWSAWILIPIPTTRPASDALYFAGSAWGTETWRLMASPTVATPEQNLEYVAQQWEVNFLADSMLESGRLEHKAATYGWEGILDGATITDYGTRTHIPRTVSGSPAMLDLTSRLEWEAAAAATDAVAGCAIDLAGLMRPGVLLHAVFALTGGATTETRLLCGLVQTSEKASAMADNDPGSVNQFGAAGYASAAANVSAYSRTTGSLTTRATTQAVSTGTDQMLDFKMQQAPNGGATRLILATKTGTTKTQILSTLTAPGNLNQAVTFFLRASAGGTSARPKVALYKLRVGFGLGLGGT